MPRQGKHFRLDLTTSKEHRMISRDVSKRIQLARYLMICGIVFIHIPPLEPQTVTDNAYFLFVRGFLVDAVFRSTVPILTCISAYLIFFYGKDKKALRLVQDKARRLIIPMIIWNLPIVATIYVLQKYGISSVLQRLYAPSHMHPSHLAFYPLHVFNMLDATLGLTDEPVNYPLFFLRDLFVLSCLAPVFGFFIRKAPVFGFIVVAVIFGLDFDGLLLLRSSMALNFYIGGIAAVYGWNLFILDKYKWSFLALFIIACILKSQTPGDSILFRVVSPFMIWPVLGLIENSRFSDVVVKLSPGSFCLFLSHAPMLLISYRLYKMFPMVDYPLYWFSSFAAVVALCASFYRLGYKTSPSTMQVVLGGR
jgi:succinoglycan biosynthesis protein ExoH